MAYCKVCKCKLRPHMEDLKPIVLEFDRVDRLFQTENRDPAKLFKNLDLLVRSMLLKVVRREHASPTADSEGH
ncbi:hypothetical protein MRX96_020374 [Rhipicephalus microplus]